MGEVVVSDINICFKIRVVKDILCMGTRREKKKKLKRKKNPDFVQLHDDCSSVGTVI